MIERPKKDIHSDSEDKISIKSKTTSNLELIKMSNNPPKHGVDAEHHNAHGKLMKQLEDNYIIVDVGANLTNKKFSRDLDAVIQRAKDAGKF